MTILAEVLKSIIEDGSRIIKVLALGGRDVKEIDEISPFGIDSSPISNMVAVYADTLEEDQKVIIGYMAENQIAGSGEFRTYSVNDEGEVMAYTWLKADGTIELGGDAHNLTRFAPLNTGLQQLINSINTELGKIATGIGAAGGSYVVDPVSININNAKIDEIKTL